MRAQRRRAAVKDDVYKHRRTRKSRAWAIAVSLPQTAALLLFFSLLLQASRVPRFEERRVSRGLSISLHRSSPPYAALEDDLMDAPTDAPAPTLARAATDLEAGRGSIEPLARVLRARAEKEARELVAEARRLGFQRSARAAQIARLRRGLDEAIRTSSLTAGLRPRPELGLGPALARAQERAGPGLLNKKGLSAAPGAYERSSVARGDAAGPAPSSSPGMSAPKRSSLALSLGLGRSRTMAALFAPIVAEGGPELAARFAASAGASQEEATRAGVAVATAMAIRAPAGSSPAAWAPWLVASSGRKRAPGAPASQALRAPPVAAFFAAAGVGAASSPSIDPPAAPAVVSPVAALALGDRALDDAGAKPESRAQIVVSGSIEVTAGLALTGPKDRVVVYREIDGRVAESGTVSLKDARYEILISERTGRIVAELQSPNGDAIGRGAVEMASLGPATARFRFDQFDLKMAPVPSGFFGRAVALNDTLSMAASSAPAFRSPARGARIELDSASGGAISRASGEFDVQRALEGSTAIARASKPGFWTALAYVAAGAESKIAVFAQKAAAAILGVVAPSTQEKDARTESAIAWGRVTKQGRLVAGAQVELLTAPEGVRAIYFDGAGRPDLSLKQTSENGLYAFFPVLPGVQLAQASLPGESSEVVVFPAEAGATTRADVEISFDRKIPVRVFDAFRTSRGLQGRLASFGRETETETDAEGNGEALISSSDGLAFVDVEAGREYLASRVAISRDRRLLLAPMIRQSWLDELSGAHRITQTPNSGVAVAFVQGDRPYRAWFSADGRSGSERIIYFDQNGRPTGEDFGRPGGGFVVFNLAEGLRTATIEPWQSPRWSYQTILVDRKVVDVSSIWLR